MESKRKGKARPGEDVRKGKGATPLNDETNPEPSAPRFGLEPVSNSPSGEPAAKENNPAGEAILKRRKWDSRTKARIVLEGLQGGQVSAICQEYGIRPGQYYKWRDHFLAHCARAFEGPPKTPGHAALVSENENLKRLVGELTLELNKRNN